MDAAARPAKNSGMPLPAHSIDKLSDHSGAYVICVSCGKCRHEREIEPRALANILGWNTTLKQACLRLRCSKCQARQVKVEIAFERKPRGWKSNPS
jgi:ssDNA-binding Zn-finger/Zn-ribbon topoisomerase 1